MDDRDRAITALSERQHGVWSHRQARELGFSQEAIEWRVGQGRWVGLSPAAFRIAGVRVTWHGNVMLACLDSRAVASHRTAAVLWKLDGHRPGRPEVTVPRGVRYRRRDARVHESTQFDLARVTQREGIPVTGLARTILDLGAVMPWQEVEFAIDDVRRRHLLDWPDLYETLVLHARRGRNGVGPFRAVLDARYGEKVVPDSKFERLVIRLLLDAGLPAPVRQFRVYDGNRFVARIDLAYPEARVLIELQSKAHHLDPVAFERDKERLNECRLLGWKTFEFTWKMYVERPTYICDTVANALNGSCDK